MGEIGTHSMIKVKVSNYQYTGSGCPTITEINASGTVKVNGSYGGNECPVINDVVNSKPTNYIYSRYRIYDDGDYGVYVDSSYPVTSKIHGTVYITDCAGRFNFDFTLEVGKNYVGIGKGPDEVYEVTCTGSPSEDATYRYIYG